MAWMDGCPIIVLLNHSLLKNFYFLWMMEARDEAQGAWRGRPVIQLSIYYYVHYPTTMSMGGVAVTHHSPRGHPNGEAFSICR